MKRSFPLDLTGLLICLLLTGCGAGPSQFELSLPDVDGWDRGKLRPFEDESDGYSVPYNSADGVAATVYVYNRGLGQIPDDLTSSVVQGELDNAKGQIMTAKQMGLYTSVEETGNDTVPMGDSPTAPKALRVSYRLETSSGRAISDIFLTVYQNHFIKIRCTRPTDNTAATDESINNLLSQLGSVLAP